ncbi:MAG: hypothetical protein ACOYM4_10460 [Nodosilinea sp.]
MQSADGPGIYLIQVDATQMGSLRRMVPAPSTVARMPAMTRLCWAVGA